VSELSKETSARFEASGRSAKVAAMVTVVEQVAEALGYKPHGDAEEIASRLRALDETAWLNMQKLAGFKRKEPPSEETRNGVIDTFYRRIDLSAEAAES
jgi:hypothetical protein